MDDTASGGESETEWEDVEGECLPMHILVVEVPLALLLHTGLEYGGESTGTGGSLEIIVSTGGGGKGKG